MSDKPITAEVARRRESCDCPPDFHLCSAIAESERLTEIDAARNERVRAERVDSLRIETIAQAKVLKNIFPAVSDFCDNVVELLEGTDDGN